MVRFALSAVLVWLSFAIVALAAEPTMIFPGRDWEEASPESQGFDSARLREAIAALEKNAGRDGVQELVIVRNGRMIWRGPNIDKVHGVWSCTKSFTSTVLGLLIDDGKCTLDTPAAQFVPSLAASYPKVTLRHFTTMTSGYRATGDEPTGSYTHGPSNTPLVPSDKPLFAPGEKYAYWDSAMNQFGYVLTRIAGEPMEELFQRRISDTIGMNRKQWKWGELAKVEGLAVNGGAGNMSRHVQISAREMARLGHLFLNRGNWNGKQLISEAWVEQATKVHVPASLPWGHPQSKIDGRGVYGFNWWVNGITPDGTRHWPGAPVGTFAASGHNNNKLFVVPEWNLVVVRLGLDQSDRVIGNEAWSEFFAGLHAAMINRPSSAK